MPGGAGFQYQQSGYSGTPPKPGSGGYDGPPSTTDGPQQRGPNPFGGVKPLGYDPAKPPTKEKVIPMSMLNISPSLFIAMLICFDRLGVTSCCLCPGKRRMYFLLDLPCHNSVSPEV